VTFEHFDKKNCIPCLMCCVVEQRQSEASAMLCIAWY